MRRPRGYLALLMAAVLVSGACADTTGTAAEPGEVLAAVEEARVFVARERDLSFSRPLLVRVLSDEDFTSLANAKAERGRTNAERTEFLLVALGLLPRGTDLLDELSALNSSKAALYHGGELAVRGVRPTPRVRVQLAQELTVALLDQRFGLDGSGFAFTALVAADVLRVVSAYRSTLPVQAAFDGPVDRQTSTVVARFAALPSQRGSALVDAILTKGGLPALDRAIADPPVTAAQVLFPERYFAREKPVEVPAPDADGAIVGEGSFGLDHLVYLIGDSPTADVAVRAWAGDHYVAWRAGDRSCIRVAFAARTPRGVNDLDDALNLWRGAASVVRSGDRVLLSSCEVAS